MRASPVLMYVAQCVHSQLWKIFAELKGNVTDVVILTSLVYVCTYT